MVCACALWITEGTQNAISEQLFRNAFRMLPGILTEAPATVSIATLLLTVCRLDQHGGHVEVDNLSGDLPHDNI